VFLADAREKFGRGRVVKWGDMCSIWRNGGLVSHDYGLWGVMKCMNNVMFILKIKKYIF
jgi:hypothetical protein